MAFHGGTQRLAVGTSDGAVVVYDVKTATRLYVLEAHHAAITAISFAPDGRRLVTVALADSHVAVWKVGQSLLGLLTPAGPPRQGSGGTGKPYKVWGRRPALAHG
jgi:WD40 repeat protein